MDESSQAHLIRDALLVVMRRRRIILSVYAGVLVSAVAGIFLIEPQYRAAAKVLLTTNRADIATSSDRTTELVRNEVNEPELNSQLEIVRSRDLVESVLAHLDMPAEEPPPPPPSGIAAVVNTVANLQMTLLRRGYRSLHNLHDVEPSSPLYWKAMRVLNGLGTASLKSSNVIEVSFTGRDPVWARTFVNALTAAYVDRQAQMQGTTQAQSFFTNQSELLRQKLADSEAALHQLREKAGVLAGQQAEVHQRLNEFNAELARTKIARAEQGQRVAFLEQMHTSGRGGRVASPQLLELEAKRAELIGRYREDSERVRDLDRQIRALRAAISSYDTIPTSEEARSGAGSTDLMSARAGVAALKGKEEALARERDEYRRQAELLDAQDFDLVRLDRQGKLDEEAYLSYVRTAEEFRLSTALEQSKILRLQIVELASVPMEPVSPNKSRILAFALIGGLAVSLAAGIAREHFDTTIKSPADVRRYANLDVLAVLPERGGAA